MRQGVVLLLGLIGAVIVGVDVAGLTGAFGYPKYDAGASTIATSTGTAPSSNSRTKPSSKTTPSGSPPPSSAAPVTTSTPPSS